MKILCPPAAALPAITKVTCGQKLDQIVGMALQRRQPVGSSTFTTATIKLLATWTALLAAVANTKVTVTPLFASFVIPPSEGQEEGGNDNSTINGIPIDLGEGAVKVTGEFRNLPSAVKAQLDLMRGESQASVGISNLAAFLFNKDGDIAHSLEASAGDPIGLPIYNFRLGSRGSNGLKSDDIIPFSFYMAEGWDKLLTMTTPSFNPLLEL